MDTASGEKKTGMCPVYVAIRILTQWFRQIPNSQDEILRKRPRKQI